MTQSNEINFEDQNIYIGFEIKFSSAFICDILLSLHSHMIKQ